MIELAHDELINFGKVWLSIFVSLTYCYIIGKITSKGITRLVAFLPIITLFLILPLNLTSVHFCGLTAFFISWLANFKLLLFAFGKPPLCFDPPISFPLFLAVSCLPIKVQPPTNLLNQEINKNPDQKSQNNSYPSHQKSQNIQKSQNKSYPSQEKSQNPKKSPWNYFTKGVLLAILIKLYDYSDQIHPKILWLFYFFHIYFALEIILAILANSVNHFLGLELEPQFNEPLLSTSLQDFWGKRWNLMVTSILRPTVYLPTRDLFSGIVGRDAAALAAVMATFIVSAIMHEIIFYYIGCGRVGPTFEGTWFFVLHGFCLCIEIAVKKYGRERKWWVPPPWFSGVVTMAIVVGTGFWLFLPPLLNAELTRGLDEYAAAAVFVKRIIGLEF